MKNWLDITTRGILIILGVSIWVISRELVPQAPSFLSMAIFDWMIPFTCGAFVGVQFGEIMKEII